MTVENTAEKTLAPEQQVRRTVSGFLDRLLQKINGQDGHHQARHMSLIAFVIRVMSAGIAFLSQIFLARLMGQFEYGIFVFVWVMAVIAGNLSCLGFHTAIIRFLPQYRSSGAIEEIRGITFTTRLVALAAASLVAAIGIALLYVLGDRMPVYYLAPLVLGAILLPMIALGDAMEGTARANSWVVQALTPTYLVRPILIPLAMVAAVVLGFDASAKTALIAAIIATYATTAGQLIILGRRLRSRYEPGPRKVHLAYWVKIALPIFLIEGFYFLLTNSDVVMVGLFLQPDQVATYFAAAKTMALVHFVFFAVKAGMTPRFSQLVAEEKSDELARFAVSAARWTFWPSLAVGGVVLLLGPFLLSLFGPDFAAGYSVMFILFAGIAAKAFIGPGEALLTMTGQQKICALIYFAVLAVNVAGNIVLIPQFGINGAAAATMTAMFAEALLLFFIVRSRLGINMNVLSKPQRIAANSEAG
ncbi:lipopolysaccharide biosynthesis protein [Hoeflea sp. TYP-13]|uniref:lipopolysaccharide biosynthesis protein n=1 Tax=Hoeflea sp. TYP-13 TaxID=3230023 RepID=UPI0034C6B89F